jgi:uncharacterized paraquat-inducible protein A
MEEEDCVCEVCDSEFTVKHFQEDQVAFCPFCGESQFKDNEDDIDIDDWEDDDEK